MTDLEITRLCAKAMDIHQLPGLVGDSYSAPIEHIYLPGRIVYDPLHDDAQAMALVKNFQIYQAWDHALSVWDTEIWWHLPPIGYRASNANINRAICECVAKMQSAKAPV